MKPLPKRRFVKGKNVTVSIRMPQGLKDELERLAKEQGRGFSELIQDGLDQWAQAHQDTKAATKVKGN